MIPGINGRHSLVSVLIFVAACLSSCISVSTPTRPAYDGIDSVSSALASQFVGAWRVTDINPSPNATPQETIIEYKSNGKVVGQVKTNASQAAQNLTYQLTGNWTLEGDTITHSNIRMTSKSDDRVAQLLSAMINSSNQQLGGQANVYQLSDNRIVMVGTDGAAMEYVRLR